MSALKPCIGPGERLPEPEHLLSSTEQLREIGRALGTISKMTTEAFEALVEGYIEAFAPETRPETRRDRIADWFWTRGPGVVIVKIRDRRR